MANSSRQRSVLGKGFSFPVAFTGNSSTSNRGMAMASEVDKVRMSLLVILGTLVGSRIMRRDFGCQLRTLVFDTIQPDWELLAEHLIRDGIARWERRGALR